MRKALLILCALPLLLGGWLAAPGQAGAAKPAVTTNAEASALIDVQSGRLLYEKQPDKQMKIASLTKIMTAIVAIEEGKLSDRVTVSKAAFGKEGSSIYLKLGEQMSLHDLLYGMMLRSGNDAATAIAEHVGGSVEGFAFLMNQKAQEIGMRNSQFKNPHGLDEAGHYSTARDMALLTAYALRNPVFQEIVKTEMKKVARPEEKWDAVWRNKNKMLYLYPGADGVKTGYTKTAGRCLVSSATKNGQQLAVVTLSDPDDWADHKRLFDYGFEHYPLATVIKQGDKAADGILFGRSFRYPLLEGEEKQLTEQLVLEKPESAAYRLGDRGRVELSLDGRLIGSVPLYSEGSTRIRQEDDAAFRFKPTEAPAKRSFLQTAGSVLRALFAGGATIR
ncbi:D-alanyl-D-alanine carboxypeptidase DacB [Paenibacillus sp. J31TS4]|uniref:D-alanyl-D-alanine carboxypeptidase family protein n=1 Tax=Paenibacillus sp. J31TS4 TaxID=2807195 RepID=UPI001B2C0C1E|nr:D-alanyl-D-alanine carboxypeptidase family protein [Paenibacillus sp. J31TS4]GIP37516.1 D-alanyl-D-alanine carboxypeptidase DacB [Paenibacillus sp. J31TS4]